MAAATHLTKADLAQLQGILDGFAFDVPEGSTWYPISSVWWNKYKNRVEQDSEDIFVPAVINNKRLESKVFPSFLNKGVVRSIFCFVHVGSTWACA
jgi:hypothetical protein